MGLSAPSNNTRKPNLLPKLFHLVRIPSDHHLHRISVETVPDCISRLRLEKASETLVHEPISKLKLLK